MRKFITYYGLTENLEEKERLLKELFTPDELEMLEKRFTVLEALNSGKSQKEVKEELKVSTSTVTKGATILKYGDEIIPILLSRVQGTVESND